MKIKTLILLTIFQLRAYAQKPLRVVVKSAINTLFKIANSVCHSLFRMHLISFRSRD